MKSDVCHQSSSLICLSSIVHLDVKNYFTLIYSEELSEFTHIYTQTHSHASAYTHSTYLNVNDTIENHS